MPLPMPLVDREGADASTVSYAYAILATVDHANLRNGNNLPALAFCIGVEG